MAEGNLTAFSIPLPDELYLEIFEFYVFALFETYKSKIRQRLKTEPRSSPITVLAASSRFGARLWRPVLFESLTLRTAQDVRSLERIVRSHLSGWLRDHILAIQLLPPASGSGFHELYSAWTSLSVHLTRLNKFDFDSDNAPWVVSLRPCPSSLRDVTTLCMKQLTFSSFSALYRELSSLPNLKELQMHDISWRAPCDSARLPSSSSGFRNITSINIMSCTSAWPFTWIPLASRFGCGSSSVAQSGAVSSASHADVRVVVQLAGLLEQLNAREFTSINFDEVHSDADLNGAFALRIGINRQELALKFTGNFGPSYSPDSGDTRLMRCSPISSVTVEAQDRSWITIDWQQFGSILTHLPIGISVCISAPAEYLSESDREMLQQHMPGRQISIRTAARVLKAGTVTISNRQTGKSAYLPSSDNSQSLHTKSNDDTDAFKWIVVKQDNGRYTVRNLKTQQFACVSPTPKEESQVVAESSYMIEWRIVSTGETDVYWIAPMNQDHFWGISSPVAEIYHTQIRLREGYTDGLNNWTIADYAIPPYVAVRAGYDCHPDRTSCLEGTRTRILETIRAWATSPTAESTGERLPNIFWLNGLAGTGKTTVAYTVAEQCHVKGILGASFFCSRSIADCNDPSKIFPTIAYQLGMFYRPYRDHVAEVLHRDPLLVYASISRQIEELIVQPLKLLRDNFPLCIVVIDALDECKDPAVTSATLSTLLRYEEILFPLRFFVISRPEMHISVSFRTPGYRGASGQPLLREIALELATADIRFFLETSLSQIRQHFGLPDSWPAEADVDVLTRLANGLFLFAAAAVKFVGDRRFSDPDEQLEILTSKAASHGSHTLLDNLYLQVLESAFPEVSERLSARLKSILGSIILIKDPLPLTDLSHLIGLPTGVVYSSLSGLHSVLAVPEHEDSATSIRLIHPTFAEFLLDPKRCTNPSFAIDSRHQHTRLLHGCLNAMRELRQDICEIRDPSVLNVEVPDLLDRLAKAIPLYLRYACHHWAVHLSVGDLPDEILDMLLEFAEIRLPYWVEACSLLGILKDAISALNESQQRLMGLDDNRARRVAALFHDCERLVVGFFPSTSSSALQLYHSVLPCIPKETALAKIYADERRAESSVKVIHGVADSWDPCLGTVIAHGGNEVRAVDFSPDGRTVASAGDDTGIRIWDALTCTLLLVLSGHTRTVHSVRHSPDGTRIVSAAGDQTVKVWDAESGMLDHTLVVSWVIDAVFTPDGGRIISGSDDGTIKIWDARSGTCLATPATNHPGGVTFIAVSPDGLWMASSSVGGQVYLRSMNAPFPYRVLAAQSGPHCPIAFTHDSSGIITSSYHLRGSGSTSVWDVMSGKQLRTLKPSGVPSLCFSCLALNPAGDEFACGSDNTVAIVDLSSGEVRRTLAGHTQSVTSVSYNREGTRVVSGSKDGSMRLWDVSEYTMSMAPLRSTGRDSDVSGGVYSLRCVSAAFSNDGSRLLCVCGNGTIEVERTDTWDQMWKPLSRERRSFNYAAFSPDGSVMLAVDLDRGETSIWDATTGSLRALFPHSYNGLPVDETMWSGVLGYVPLCFGGHSSTTMFSQDSRYLAAASGTAVHLWSVATGKLVREFSEHTEPVLCVTFSLDANRIATGSEDRSTMIWDVATGASRATCRGHDGPVCAVAFSATGDLVASGSSYGHVRVWDAETGDGLQSFSGHPDPIRSVAFTPGSDVVISAEDGAMRLWDVETGDCLHVFNPRTWVRTIELAPDGTGIIVSGGRVIQLWSPSSPETNAQSTTTLPWLPRRTWPVYYIEDGWVFSLTPVRRTRLCWVPAEWQEVKAYFSHTVVFGNGRKMDFTALSSYLDTLHSGVW